MPIYEYQCQACGHQMEALQKISDDPLQECPKCHQSSLQKLVSAASFRLKGGGWYETDFKSGDKKHLADTDSGNRSETSTDSPEKGSTQKDGADKDAGKTGKKDKNIQSSAGDSKSTSKSKSTGKDSSAARN